MGYHVWEPAFPTGDRWFSVAPGDAKEPGTQTLSVRSQGSQ
jgi:hypothetical protein